MSWDLKWRVEEWLERLGLASYTEPFLDNGYNLQELCANLKDEDLDAIGVHNDIHRTLIFAESSTLRDEAMARFKKSKGGGSAGSTDQSGSMGSHGSFPAYTEPWGDEASVPKHFYSDVWEQNDGAVRTNTPALAQLMQNGGHGQPLADFGDKQKGSTFPTAPPSKAPRKKQLVSPGSQTSFTLPAAPALPPPRSAQGNTAPVSLNKLQLKLKVLEELQRDRIILSEPPYCKEDGTLEEGKVTELSQMYAERFNMEPTQIMGTIKDICKGPEIKVHDGTDGGYPSFHSTQKAPVLSTSDLYEEPVDKMRNDITTFKDSSPPSKPKSGVAVDSASEAIYAEPDEPLSLTSSPIKKGKKMKGSPLLLRKPKPSSSESSPEQKRRASPRSSPRCSPYSSPATSPREHKKFGLFGKRKTKKTAARSNSAKEMDLTQQSKKAGKVVLLPGKAKMNAAEDLTTASPSLPLASRKRSARGSLTLPPPSPSTTSNQHSPEFKSRTVSMSSTSTTGSETSPLAPKKFGILRFSQRWGSPQRQHKSKTSGGRKDDLRKSLTASDVELNKIGLKADAERPPELLRCAQSHEHLYGSRVSIDSPPTTPSTKKRGGLFNIFKKRKTAGKRQGKGERERGTEGEGGDSVEVGGRQEEDKSFLTSSISMPNIASSGLRLQNSVTPSSPPVHFRQDIVQDDKSATAPPKPSRLSRRVRVQSPVNAPLPSPDPSPLPQRKVMQVGATPSGDFLIPIQHRDRGGEREGNITSWRPVSPSNLLQNPTQRFESDVFSGVTSHENVSDFRELSQTPQRPSLGSYRSETSDTVDMSSVSSRTGDVHVVGSVESHNSSVFGSYTSDSSMTGTKTGSLRKPLPPPKPKSLERPKTRGQSSAPPSEGRVIRGKASSDSGCGKSGIDRSIPPPKPPRPMRGSLKREPVDAESEMKDGGRDGKGSGSEPPPKPARRNRSLKLTGTAQQHVVSPQRKAQTIQHVFQTIASGSEPASQSSIDSMPVSPRKPIPAPKPRPSSSDQTEQVSSPSAPASLKDSVAAKLSKEGIDLTNSPYSTVWGEWRVPALLVSRYAQELDQPPESIALILDDIRGHDLKKVTRDYVPVKMTDCMKNTAIYNDSVANFLTSIGLPMYSSVLTHSRGFVNVPSLRCLNETRLHELNIIIPLHRRILLEQLRT